MSDAALNALFLALVVILPVSALVARRLPFGASVKMAVAWVAIFALLFVAVALWQRAMGAGSTVGSLFQ